jgi:hypothetical protein
MKAYCSGCGLLHDIQPSFTGKIIAAGLSSVLTYKMTKNPWIIGVTTIISTAVGHLIDKVIERRCPKCRNIFKILALVEN